MAGFFDRLKNIAKTLFRYGGLIYTPIAILAFFAPSTVRATSDPLPFTPANNGCGPYQASTVTGSSGGAIWGSNPYTDDSTFSSAAVHAGLIAIGETAIIEPYMVDNYPSYKGSAANGVSTYDWGGSWCGYYIRILGTTGEIPTTTEPNTICPPLNLTVIDNGSSVFLDWDAPNCGNVQPERYAISWNVPPNNGVGIATGNSGDEESLKTFMNIPYETVNDAGAMPADYRFSVRSDNDTLRLYSEWSNEVTLSLAEYPTTTSSTTTTIPETTTTWVPTTTSTVPPTTSITTAPIETVPATTEAPTETTITEEPETTPTTEAEVAVETSAPEPEQEGPDSTVPESTEPPETTPTTSEAPIEVPEDVQDEADAAVDEILASSENIEELSDAVDELVAEADTPEELVAVIDALLGTDLTDEQFDAVIDSVFSEPLTDENFSAALDAVFEEPLSDEKFDSVITAILDEPISDEQFEELVSVLESDSVSEEQVSAAVDEIIANDISEEQAVDLATSAKVLESVNGDQATEIFDAVDISAVTSEEAAELISAVQDAPTEVKEAFETEINVFQGAIDTYVPLGSSISVGERRVVVAVSAVIVVAPAPIISRRR